MSNSIIDNERDKEIMKRHGVFIKSNITKEKREKLENDLKNLGSQAWIITSDDEMDQLEMTTL